MNTEKGGVTGESGDIIAVSACLAGDNCTRRGTNNIIPRIKELADRGRAIKICPEALGGLDTPRKRAEIVGGAGSEVLRGEARVLEEGGGDVTKEFLMGAQLSYEAVGGRGIERAVFKSKSPSCGCGQIYDGTFTNRLRKGDGVTAALFRQNGIKIVCEDGYTGG